MAKDGLTLLCEALSTPLTFDEADKKTIALFLTQCVSHDDLSFKEIAKRDLRILTIYHRSRFINDVDNCLEHLSNWLLTQKIQVAPSPREWAILRDLAFLAPDFSQLKKSDFFDKKLNLVNNKIQRCYEIADFLEIGPAFYSIKQSPTIFFKQEARPLLKRMHDQNEFDYLKSLGLLGLILSNPQPQPKK